MFFFKTCLPLFQSGSCLQKSKQLLRRVTSEISSALEAVIERSSLFGTYVGVKKMTTLLVLFLLLGANSHADWFWTNPLPQGRLLDDVWAAENGEIWTVGDYGTIAHRNTNGKWSLVDAGGGYKLKGIWGSGHDEIFAVGSDDSATSEGVHLHWNGSSWSEMPGDAPRTLNAVWGFAGNDVYAVAYGRIEHWNGVIWTGVQIGNLRTFYDIWGASPNDIWAVAETGQAWHYNGNSWSYNHVGSDSTLHGIWGRSTDDVYAVGRDQNGRCIVHWNGSSWTTEYNDFTEGNLNDIGETSTGDLFAIGDDGTILHYNGTSWVDSSSLPNNRNLLGMCSNGAGGLIAVGDAGWIVEYESSQWQEESYGTVEYIYGLWGVSSNDMFAVTQYSTQTYETGSILHYDGYRWVTMVTSSEYLLRDIWGTSGDNIYAVGRNGLILHWDGLNWTQMVSGASYELVTVWGSSADDIFAAGDQGCIVHWNGSIWSPMVSPTSGVIRALFGFSSDDIFACGGYNVMLHWNGATWSQMESPSSEIMTGLWGEANDDLYVAICTGEIRHWNGEIWTTVYNDNDTCWADIWGSQSDDIYAIGQDEKILHWDGVNWTLQRDGALSFFTLWGVSADTIFVGGQDGSILRGPASWQTPTETPTPSPTLSVTPTITPTETPEPEYIWFQVDTNQSWFSSSDRFQLQLSIYNHWSHPVQLYAYVALEVDGFYFFYPSWTETVEGFPLNLLPHDHYIDVLLDLTLPESLQPGGPYWIWGAGVDAITEVLLTTISMEAFRFD